MAHTIDRSKRVRRLKKMIPGTIALLILIPTVLCIYLGIRVADLKAQLKSLSLQLSMQLQVDEESGVYETSGVKEAVLSYETDGTEAESGIAEDKEVVRKIYLTFDDGPSVNTDQILDILKEYDIKATFFVVGKTDAGSEAAYQRIVEEGHTLAMHSYSHKYDEIYESKEAFVSDLTRLQEYLYEITGVWPRLYRFPGGSSNTVSRVEMSELIRYLTDVGIVYYDWNVASGDAVSRTLSVETIVANCMTGINKQSESVVLLHDAANRKTTVEALPEIIEQVLAQGDAVFLPITDETVPVQHLAATENNK